ncbi:MAG: hypothetical protein HOW73_46230 [Polyangiaceae bacterium]|nr:hypothetical protein [Polyangiaceae bacterium]
MLEDDDSPPSTYRGRSAIGANALRALKLLRATAASLRCRELIELGSLDEAKSLLSVLREEIDELSRLPLQVGSAKELGLLRAQERGLASQLSRAAK